MAYDAAWNGRFLLKKSFEMPKQPSLARFTPRNTLCGIAYLLSFKWTKI